MAILERTVVEYRVKCDGCGCWGAGGWSPNEAIELAEEEGFAIETRFGGLKWYNEHLCLDCFTEKQQKEESSDDQRS